MTRGPLFSTQGWTNENGKFLVVTWTVGSSLGHPCEKTPSSPVLVRTLAARMERSSDWLGCGFAPVCVCFHFYLPKHQLFLHLPSEQKRSCPTTLEVLCYEHNHMKILMRLNGAPVQLPGKEALAHPRCTAHLLHGQGGRSPSYSPDGQGLPL